MLSRRDFVKFTGVAFVAGAAESALSALISSERKSDEEGAMRCINVVNFIRGVEPRFVTDLLLPVKNQMESILANDLPATWLLQFDALVAGDFVAYLKANMAPSHEVGFWFEMNEKLCDAAGVKWRGRPGYEWDHLPLVAFTIGYTPEERVLLADAAMKGFKEIWGHYPASVASWNLDSVTIAHLVEHYSVDAFAVCRDQIATDGFTIWGGPIAGYYPSKKNCWSPALTRADQIGAPVFRMLGQDPVHYYTRNYPLPDGRVISEPDTMEPVWTAGQSPIFVKTFLDMIAQADCLKFSYAQLGQENSFPWAQMEEAYPKQMTALAELRRSGTVHVETMGDSGRRFKKGFKLTPAQAQIMLDDPLGDTSPAEGSIWYQSRFYRANLHLRGNVPFFRDITVYSDENAQPFLTEATRQNDVEQRLPAVIDGYHWSTRPGSTTEIGAGGFFEVGGKRLLLAGKPMVTEKGNMLQAVFPLEEGGELLVRFDEKSISMELRGGSHGPLTLNFVWDSKKAALKSFEGNRALYSWQGFEYAVTVSGKGEVTQSGWSATALGKDLQLHLAQRK